MLGPVGARRVQVLAIVVGVCCAILSGCVGAEPPIPEDNVDGGHDASVVHMMDTGAPDATVDEGAPGDAAAEASALDAGPDSASDAMAAPPCPGTDHLCGGVCVPDDPRNCGGCGHDCTNLSNVSGTVTCVSGVCTFDNSACKSGFAHCTGSPDVGCETNVGTPSNCGMCGNACPQSAPLCSSSGSSSACVSGCAASAPTLCGGTTCVNTTNDAQNCGGCGVPCTTSVAHAQATCASSQCGYQCTASYPNPCGGGCVNFSNDNNNCGGCGAPCTNGKTCQGGGCGCPGGTHDCNGTCYSNSSTATCGTGPSSCQPCAVPANGSATCNGTACGISCNTGLQPCSNNTTCVDETLNGNCGGCGVTCPISCTSSKCIKATAIAAGYAHTCALLSDGTVECWGVNYYGQLGSTASSTCSSNPCAITPQPVPGLSGVIAIGSGDYTTCAVLTGGAVKCWGLNSWGETGAPAGGNTTSPYSVSGLSGPAIAVAPGYEATCALISGGTVQCWGNNNAGQLGNGKMTASASPQTVSNLTTATAITAGELHFCALRADHTVVCWGDNSDSELGSPQTICDPPNSDYCSTTPVQVYGLTAVSAISSAAIGNCALVGVNVKCWGYLQAGLGDQAATQTTYMPVTAYNISSAVGVAVGDSSMCALLSGGSAACWGGVPLGDGTTNETATSVPVSNLTGATALTAGLSHKCALLSTGAVSCWSDNTSGQLGNGTTAPSLTPTPVTW